VFGPIWCTYYVVVHDATCPWVKLTKCRGSADACTRGCDGIVQPVVVAPCNTVLAPSGCHPAPEDVQPVIEQN
jgi:hypothetical protein